MVLYLANFDGEAELGKAVDWLIGQGVSIISMSVSYPTGGPGDGTGSVAGIVDRARAAGVLWVQAAGNYGDKHWQGMFVDSDSDSLLDFSAIAVAAGNRIRASQGDQVRVRLRWDDPWGASGNNYDLLLLDGNGAIVASSTDLQDGDDRPQETVMYTTRHAGEFSIAVRATGSPAPVMLHLFSSNHELRYQVAAGSLAVPADSPNAMAVGAVGLSRPDSIAPYSSRGPTKDGRVKPDLVAPDGVLTASKGPKPFFGTSAAVPQAAGAAALVKQRYPAYGPADIQAFLENAARDLGTAGKDSVFGSGLLNLGPP